MASARLTATPANGEKCYALSVEPRLVTLRYNGQPVVQSSCAIRAERPGEAPVFFVPAEDVVEVGLEASATLVSAPGLGRARCVDVCTRDKRLCAAAYQLEETTELGSRLRGRVGFAANRFEQDQPIKSQID